MRGSDCRRAIAPAIADEGDGCVGDQHQRGHEQPERRERLRPQRSVTTNDATTNVYEVAYSYGNCTGSYAALNGVQFTGLATLSTGSSSGQLIVAVTGASSSTQYGIVSTLTGS